MELAQPPYYAVIFSSLRTQVTENYEYTNEILMHSAEKIIGFIEMNAVRDKNGKGIAISYWKDLESIEKWKNNLQHIAAKKMGREKWYHSYKIEFSKVDKMHIFK